MFTNFERLDLSQERDFNSDEDEDEDAATRSEASPAARRSRTRTHQAPSQIQRASSYVWGASSRKSFESAKKHFDSFLQGLDDNALGSLMGHDELEGRTYDTIKKEKITHGLMDAFAGYLSNAKWLNNPSKFLSLNCADRYFSSVKNKLISDLSEANKLNEIISNDVAMARIRTGMLKNITNRAMAQGVDVTKPHQVADEDDIKSLAITCFWSVEHTLATMLFYFLSLVQLAGRAAEIATIKFSDMALYRPGEFAPNEKIASIRLWRTKTFNRQELSIFPHCDTFLQDWYFAMGYSMIMQEEGSEYLFPTFASKVQRAAPPVEQEQNLTERQIEGQNKAVTGYFKDILVRIIEASTNFVGNHFGGGEGGIDGGGPPDDGNEDDVGGANQQLQALLSAYVQNYQINKKLSSHSGKRAGVNPLWW